VVTRPTAGGAFDPTIAIERAWTPPAAWYTSPEIYELERRTVFRRSWQPFVRAAELGESGAYASGCFAGEPWVVVRDGDTARAFYNVCRHKGREVVTGSGSAEELVCGYHAWSYDLGGRLRRAPRMAGIEDFDREAMSLPPLALASWGPWHFVSREPGAAPPVALHPEVDRALAESGWEGLRFFARRSWEIGCNWKVYVDNYLDGGYHVPHMHPTLDAQIDMQSYRTDVFARSSIQGAPPLARRDGRIDYDPAVRIGERAIYAWLYPNFMINRYGPCMDTNHVIPLGVDRCRVEYEFYFDGTPTQAFIDESIAQADVTQREDIAICESVQRGLLSESYDRGRYAPRVEMGEHHFHCLLAADYHQSL
jgi:choline monooxygenase